MWRFGPRRAKPSVITLADEARDREQWECAAGYYRDALERNPRNAPIWVQYGHVLKEAGHLAEAESAYRTALACGARKADSYVQLGHVLKMKGRKEEARAAYLRGFALDPSLDGASFEFAQLGWSETHISEMRGMLQSDAAQRDHSDIGRGGPNGSAATLLRALESVDPAEHSQDYSEWVRLYDTIDDDARRAIAIAIGELTSRPLISIVMPVYNTPEPYLRAAIDSVRQQLYPHWELCIADDASTLPHVKHVLEYYRSIDRRIKVCYRSENGHISAASNSALALAEGSFIALLDHDDVLTEHALYMVAATLDAEPEIDLIYSDEDKIDAVGRRFGPYFKSDWNPELMLSQNMFCHLGVYRRSLIEKIGGFRYGYEGSQDYDLILRAQRLTSPNRIRHIPHILYHWRAVQSSVAHRPEEKPYAVESARRAIADHLAEVGVIAEVLASSCPMFHRVRYSLPQPPPRLTIIVPTRDRADLLHKCVEGLLHRTDYPDLELLIVDNQSKEPATCAYLEQLRQNARIRILSYDAPFNYSAINNFAVARATGSLLCLLNNDIEVINSDWLTEMASHALRTGIGAVGALLYYPDGRIQHGGVILGLGGLAAHVPHGSRRGDFGYFGRSAVTQNLSAVTGACLVMPKNVFDEVGGFNERDLAVTYNDVDLCLRIREAGYRIVWTPHAELYHHEAASRGPDSDPDNALRSAAEMAFMLRRWSHILHRDPYYNPNLQLNDPAFDLAFPPRIDKAWRSGTRQLFRSVQ
jgi:GT2 family glycosyltransferase